MDDDAVDASRELMHEARIAFHSKIMMLIEELRWRRERDVEHAKEVIELVKAQHQMEKTLDFEKQKHGETKDRLQLEIRSVASGFESRLLCLEAEKAKMEMLTKDVGSQIGFFKDGARTWQLEKLNAENRCQELEMALKSQQMSSRGLHQQLMLACKAVKDLQSKQVQLRQELNSLQSRVSEVVTYQRQLEMSLQWNVEELARSKATNDNLDAQIVALRSDVEVFQSARNSEKEDFHQEEKVKLLLELSQSRNRFQKLSEEHQALVDSLVQSVHVNQRWESRTKAAILEVEKWKMAAIGGCQNVNLESSIELVEDDTSVIETLLEDVLGLCCRN